MRLGASQDSKGGASLRTQLEIKREIAVANNASAETIAGIDEQINALGVTRSYNTQNREVEETVSAQTADTGWDVKSKVTAQDIRDEENVKNNSLSTQEKKRADAIVDSANTVDQVYTGLGRLKEGIVSGEYKSGMFDSTIQKINQMSPEELRTLDPKTVAKTNQLNAEQAIIVAAYVKMLSGASYTDAEFQSKKEQLSGLWSDQEDIRLNTMENFANIAYEGFERDLKWLEDKGLKKSAKDLYSTANSVRSKSQPKEAPQGKNVTKGGYRFEWDGNKYVNKGKV